MEVSGQIYTVAALPYPGKQLPVLIEYDAGWAPELVWTFRRRDVRLTSAGKWISWIFQPAA
jgi:hypothetical protein